MPFSLKRPVALAALAVVAAATIPYLPVINDYFIQDDFGVVSLLSRRSPLHFFAWFAGPWTEDIWGYVPDEVRPFPALSYALMAYFGAVSPVANHVMNLALHAGNALIVLWLAGAAAGLSLPAAVFAAIVFAVLPIQSESVAWITGRVDSLPAFFYLASFAMYVKWRRTNPARATYIASVVLFFMALYSKQNTVTLAPALLLYDVICQRNRVRFSVRPYVPYVLLTVAFLAHRYFLFHEFARETLLTGERMTAFAADVTRHLTRLVYGDRFQAMAASRALTIFVVVTAAVSLIALRVRSSTAWRAAGPALYFGVFWSILGIAPILVAGYYSPRHMYLASVGWAIVAGAGFNVLWTRAHATVLRPLAVAAAVGLVGFYLIQLSDVVRDWELRAALSQQAVVDLEREAASAPEGTLVIVGMPASSWAFSIPFSMRPPFTHADLTLRLKPVYHSSLHCCPAHLWQQYTTQTLREWLANPAHPPVIVMNWNPRSLALARVTDAERPDLRPLMSAVVQAQTRTELDGAFRSLLGQIAFAGQ